MGFYDQQYVTERFIVTSGMADIECRVYSPLPDKLAVEPLLYFSFANTIDLSLNTDPFTNAVDAFLEWGHRVISFDPPCHGSRIDQYGSNIGGLRAAFLDGADPFKLFVEDGRRVIDYCLQSGIATAGRIVVGGVSRSGYLALRLMAEESRIAALAAFCPVTDWRVIGFTEEKDRADVAGLRLSCYTDKLAGKKILIIISNHDAAVKTASCLQFYLDLQAANERADKGDSFVDLLCTDDPHHTCSGHWYSKAADYLMKQTLFKRR